MFRNHKAVFTAASFFVFSAFLAGMVLAGGSDAMAEEPAGAVYTMTNDAGGNEIVIFLRADDGSLTAAGSVATGGLGTGMGLGNQGGVILSQGHRWLFAVNAGSNEVSVLRVTKDGLELVDTVSSGGELPVSLTSYKDLLYVLNAGGDGNIAGFRVSPHGQLTLIGGSTQPLSQAGGTGAAQISFDLRGDVLVVTEKATSQIVTYTVDKFGVASGPMAHASSGATPFGFDFGLRGQFFVSEAGGDAPNSAVSSYQLSPDGSITVISASVPTGRPSACWLVVTNNGRFAFTTNTGDNSLSTFGIGFDGMIDLRDTAEVPAGTAPLDFDLTINSKFLYALNSGNGGISGFRVESDGSLTPIATGVGPGSLPSANGMAAW